MRQAGILLAAAAFAAAAPLSAREIDAKDLLDLPGADVVILGEVHDNPLHHAHQTLATQAVGAEAIVFEMLTDAEARRVTPELLADEAGLRETLGWDDKGWPDFAWYYPIFAAVEDPAIYGGDLGRETIRRAVREGAAEVLGPSAEMFDLDAPLPEEQQARREREQAAAHCNALPENLLPGMVEAQRLRDAAMARAVIAAHAETGGPVVVITGNGHARNDWGVPQALAQAAPQLDVISVAQFEEEAPPDPPYDYWLVTDPAPRPDPCEAFENR